MSDELDQKLKEIAARKAAKDQAAKEAHEEKQRAAAEKIAQAERVRKLWLERCEPLINRAVNRVNDKLANTGLSLSVVHSDRHTVVPAIANLIIILVEDAQPTSRHLTVNVAKTGKVQLSLHTPHAHPEQDVDLDSLDEEKMVGLLVSFVDAATRHPSDDD
jgi:hypothetical protein